MEDRRIARGRATRERLIEAGIDLFGRHGYEGTSIDAVLEVTGITRGALYHHFRSKSALYDAVLDRVMREVAEEVATAARGADPVAGLRAGCRMWLKIVMDRSIQQITLLDPPSVVGWLRWRDLDRIHTLGRLQRNLDRIADTGRLPHRNVELLAHMLLAALSEAALHIARSTDQATAFTDGQGAVNLLLDRLIGD